MAGSLTHARLAELADLATLPADAAALGYRLPAEWEPHQRVWVSPPHNEETWPVPGDLDAAREEFTALIQCLAQVVDVAVLSEHGIRTDDAWVRDYGPLFVLSNQVKDTPTLACHDFIFNSWGGKYDPHDHDDLVPQHIAAKLNIPVCVHDLILEGGSIDVNGRGTLLTTEQCLLHPSRNPRLSREEIQQVLGRALGVTRVIWLPGGIEGDDTDGHVDDVARFVAPGLVAAVRAEADHPDHIQLERNWRALENARDQAGETLQLVPLPTPEPRYYEFPPNRFDLGGRVPLPASHANFLISNGSVFVPVFGGPSDDLALRRLDDAMPTYRIVPIRCDHLIIGLGAIHCMTMQQPGI